MKNSDLDKKIEKILQSADNLKRAEVEEGFEQSVLSRIALRKAGRQVAMLPKRVVWQAAACVALVVGFNFYVWVGLQKSESANTNPIAEEYFSEMVNN